MAASFEIKGKTTVSLGGSAAGQTSADDQITVTEHIGKYEIHTSESGPFIPAGVRETGRFCIIRIPLTQKDEAVINAVRLAQGASAAGQLGTLGAAVSTFAVILTPTITGATIYTFPNCYFVDTVELQGWGVQPESKDVLILKAIPLTTALTTATTTYYTTSTA
jgi:hypothetical protein